MLRTEKRTRLRGKMDDVELIHGFADVRSDRFGFLSVRAERP
ncbi:hypothetical protein [Aliiroseovarius sp. YM-037]